MALEKKQSINQLRYFSLITILGVLFLIVVAQLFFLQVVKGSYYKSKSSTQRLRRVWKPALRGKILDRNLKILAENRSSFNVDIRIPEISSPRNRKNLTNVIKKLTKLLGISEKEMWANIGPRKHFPYTPARVAPDISFSQLARVAERLNDLPGVELATTPVRYYPAGELVCHLIGYVGKIYPKHPKLISGEYYIHDRVGINGIEKVCENVLHGKNGKKLVQVNHASHFDEIVDELPPVPGHDVILTIDLDLQKVLVKELEGKKGAAVAVDPRNGDVLALVSSPGFDPNIFVGTLSAKDYNFLRNNNAKPLFNRAVTGKYPPGSIFKLMTAMAGLEANVINSDTIYHDTGSVKVGKSKISNFHNHNYGNVNLNYALRVSCNTFFCFFSLKIGARNIASVARQFGFGKKTGIELPAESAGTLPDPSWKRKYRKVPWYPGDTMNLSIGHGFLEVTPLQIACMTAAIANEGMWYPPGIIKNYRIGGTYIPATKSGMSMPVPFKNEFFKIIKHGMWEVVNMPNGTGRRAKLPNLVIAGKTGSAEIRKDMTYAWFIGFAPFENPKLAISIVVEEAETGGRDAAPIAKAAFKAYFDVEEETNLVERLKM